MSTLLTISGDHYREIEDSALPLLAGIEQLEDLARELLTITDRTPAAERGELFSVRVRDAQAPLRHQAKRLHHTLLYPEVIGAMPDGTYRLNLEDGVPRNAIGSAALEIHILTNPHEVRGWRFGHHPTPLAKVIRRGLDNGLARTPLVDAQRVALARWRGLYMTQLTETHALADQLRHSDAVEALWEFVRDFNRHQRGGR